MIVRANVRLGDRDQRRRRRWPKSGWRSAGAVGAEFAAPGAALVSRHPRPHGETGRGRSCDLSRVGHVAHGRRAGRGHHRPRSPAREPRRSRRSRGHDCSAPLPREARPPPPQSRRRRVRPGGRRGRSCEETGRASRRRRHASASGDMRGAGPVGQRREAMLHSRVFGAPCGDGARRRACPYCPAGPQHITTDAGRGRRYP